MTVVLSSYTQSFIVSSLRVILLWWLCHCTAG